MDVARSSSLPSRTRILRGAAIVALAAAISTLHPQPVRAGTASISGVAYRDDDRDATRDAGEILYAGHRIYLFGPTGAYVAQSVTDTDGRYQFGGLDDATYRVEYDAVTWSSLEMTMVPTTTDSAWPRHTLNVSGAVTADFGWRPIVWSSDPNAPMSSFVAPNGMRVQVYNDAVAPQDVYAAIMKGTVGPEAGHVTVRLGLGSNNTTSTSVVNVGGTYQDFHATPYVSYAAWLETQGYTVGHEYGHAWSWYIAYIVQQDETYAAYLAARGLADDPRVGSSYAWSAAEMIAEDYRQLLGPPAGRANAQMNTEIPPAASVLGLETFLRDTFTQQPAAPAPRPTPSPTPTSSPTPTVLDIVALAVSPSPVKRTADFTFVLSKAARVTVTVLDGTGHVIKSLWNDVPKDAGAADVVWDRTSSTGRRVRPGEYTVKVRAEDSTGTSDVALATFLVA